MKKNNKLLIFEFEKFFTGNVTALGYMNFFYPRKKNTSLNVLFKGSFKNKKLKLIEEYLEENKKTIRKWHFEKISNNKFIGNGKNIKKPFEIKIDKNFLEMSYKFKTQYKSFNFSVNVHDKMYLIDKNTLINYTQISKFFIPIAESQLLYKKL